MATVDFNSAIYYTISDGKICRQHKQPVEGSTERVTKTGKTVHETFYRALRGKIMDIQTRENEYGKTWNVTLQDDSGAKEVLQFNYSSGYANGFLKALPNVDLSEEVTIVPNLKIENDKKKTTIFLQQNGEAIKWAFTKDNHNGLPQLEQKKVKGKITWDDSEAMEFLEKMVNTQILPKLKGVAAAIGDTDDTEEAPF
jgi:hypothetical protein